MKTKARRSLARLKHSLAKNAYDADGRLLAGPPGWTEEALRLVSQLPAFSPFHLEELDLSTHCSCSRALIMTEKGKYH